MARIELIGINKTFEDPAGLLELFLPKKTTKKEKADEKKHLDQPFSLKDINLKIPHGKTVALLGPSGCGKTTLLKIIAGLLQFDTGEIRFDGVNVGDLKPGERNIGMVFQNYALIPHFTTDENILSYFKFRKKTPELDADAAAKFKRTSDLMGVDINHLLGRMPTNLSGGEKQRVAIARCITRDPQMFLMDEPFSNLDQKLREKFRVNLKWLLDQFNITTVYVTHDQQEANLLADEIAIMDNGMIHQVGTFEDIYYSPKNIFVADFLNLDYETAAINWIPGDSVGEPLGGKLVGVRPEKVKPLPEAQEGSMLGAVNLTFYNALRNKSIVHLTYKGQEIQLSTDGILDYQYGDPIHFSFERFNVFDEATGERSFS